MSADGPPLVTRPEDSVPTVLPVALARSRPGLFEAMLLTVGYAVAMFGTIIAIFLVAWFALQYGEADEVVRPPADGNPTSLSSYHPTLVAVLAVSFPLGYFAGGLFALVVLRLVVKRAWTRELGLRRLPPAHLGFGVLALPAFVILSDGLALLLFRLFRMEHLLDQSNQLGELFRDFHPSFVLLAIGVCPGVVEELWCRGFLGRGLVGRYGWFTGVALSSLFFGLLHLYPPPYVVVTAVMGACLHFAYACSRSLWVPIFIHAANNGYAGLAAVGAVPTGGMDRAVAAWPALVYPLAGVVLLACGWAMWLVRAHADGPRGIMVPASQVSDQRPRMLPTLLALGSAIVLVGFIASA